MWDVLAIEPTDDPKAIRRAYAARLKQIDPDRDRETFARLREALEWALAGASEPPRPAPPRPEAAPDSGLEPATPPMTPGSAHGDIAAGRPQLRSESTPASFQSSPTAPPDVEERARHRALLTDIEAALERGDARAASQRYVRAAAVGALPLGGPEVMQERLFAVALADSRFGGKEFRELARTCGWDKPRLHAAGSDLYERVAARLAAEDWYDALVARADRKAVSGLYQVKVARLVLRRIHRPWLSGIDRYELTKCLQGYWAHKAWLSDRIDPAWVMKLEDRVAWRDSLAENRPSVVKPLLVMLYVVGVMFMLSQGRFPAGLLFLVPFAVLALARRRPDDS